ncbi:MAG: DUF2815 family protein [Peptococcaceae bacterium]|nr:DUF2815 family protein [Peptococcaceae bacterium]
MSTNVILQGRISYANIFEPRAMEGQDTRKYSLSLLISKDDEEMIAEAKDAIKEALQKGIEETWGGKKPAGLRLPLRDGDEERPDDEAYAGCYFINCNSPEKYPPQVVLRYRDPETGKPMRGDENTVYSGCICNVAINFYPYSAAGNKGVAAGLGNVQKWADGERLGGGPHSAEKDFEFEDAPEADIDDLL